MQGRSALQVLLLVLVLAAAGAAVVTASPRAEHEDGHLDHDEAHEFDVEFDTDESLGMKLDNRLVVAGFRRGREGSMGPAEATGWIHTGDRLVSVNELSCHGKSLAEVAKMLQAASKPKVLRFHTRHHDDRVSRMKIEMAAKAQSLEASGDMLFVHHDIPQGNVTFVQALFGGPPACTPMPVANAEPAHACGELTNEALLAGAIVVVERGMCAFSDKAINVQMAGGAGLIVLNDAGVAYRMPAQDGERFDVTIPVVMVGEVEAERLTTIMKIGMKPMQVQLRHGDRWCAEHRNVSTEEFHPDAVQLVHEDPPILDHEFQSGHLLLAAEDNPDLPYLFDSQADIQRFEYVRALFGGEPCHIETQGVDSRAQFRASNYRIPEGHAANDSAPVNSTGNASAPYDPFPPQTTGGMVPLVEAEPAEACKPMKGVEGKLVLVKRGVCSFDEKQAVVAAAGGVGVVVSNNAMGLSAARASNPGRATQLPVVMVTQAAGSALRKSLREAAAYQTDLMVRFQGNDRFFAAWDTIQDLIDTKQAWPKAARARRKLYFRLSREHHPDKPGGSQERFEAVSYAYRLASRKYDPSLGSIDELT